MGAQTYLLWKEGPWDLPGPGKARTLPAADEEKAETKTPTLVGTEVIVSKNLFDPERGASRTQEAEADTRSLQRIRSFVLLGTAILGSNRYAIIQDDGTSGPIPPGGRPSAVPRRFKVGDVVEGFKLAEIRDKNVVFSKGASKVELALDYFRKIETPAPVRPPTAQPGVNVPSPGPARPTTPLVPRVLPQLPRRERIPAPPNS